PTYEVEPAATEFETAKMRFSYSSLVTPDSVFEYDMQTHQRTLLKEQEIPSGYDRSLYTTERLWATASDGVRVPISIVYPKDFPRDGTGALYLTGYGSYGISIDAEFGPSRLSLLERGVAFAIAHIRGGADMGEHWKDDGKLDHKLNTFTDFIACAEHLIADGFTSPQHLAISGRSAGGLLISAVLNMRPDLFAVAVADVPFVDVLNTMLDRSIPLTVGEYEEWGDPNDPKFFDYMARYSPYDNVHATDYPNILVTGGLNDPRVQYWEPAKWVAKLRATKTDGNTLLLKTEMAGHGGPSGRYEHLKELALKYAFVLDRLGIEQPAQDLR
ncbi:MAG: S9 family peptidase, partial [Mycolicibacterium sp.]|nr:S9 family peptidase [Mycolicibacterium sp.]